MANINIVLPDADAPRVIDALCATYGYSATVPDPSNPGQTIPNPQSNQQFAKKQITRWMKEVTKAYEATAAGRTAAQDAAQAVEDEITIGVT